MAKDSSRNRKEMVKEGILEHYKGRKNKGMSKTMGKYNRVSVFKFSKLCLMVE